VAVTPDDYKLIERQPKTINRRRRPARKSDSRATNNCWQWTQG